MLTGSTAVDTMIRNVPERVVLDLSEVLAAPAPAEAPSAIPEGSPEPRIAVTMPGRPGSGVKAAPPEGRSREADFDALVLHFLLATCPSPAEAPTPDEVGPTPSEGAPPAAQRVTAGRDIPLPDGAGAPSNVPGSTAPAPGPRDRDPAAATPRPVAGNAPAVVPRNGFTPPPDTSPRPARAAVTTGVPPTADSAAPAPSATPGTSAGPDPRIPTPAAANADLGAARTPAPNPADLPAGGAPEEGAATPVEGEIEPPGAADSLPAGPPPANKQGPPTGGTPASPVPGSPEGQATNLGGDSGGDAMPGESGGRAAAMRIDGSGPATAPDSPFESILDQLRGAMRGDSGSVHMKLDPEHLGRLDVELSLGDDGLVARILASAPETAAILRADVDRLREALAASGVPLAGVDVRTGPEDAGQGAGGRTPAGARPMDLPPVAAPRRPGRELPAAPPGRLDVLA